MIHPWIRKNIVVAKTLDAILTRPTPAIAILPTDPQAQLGPGGDSWVGSKVNGQ